MYNNYVQTQTCVHIHMIIIIEHTHKTCLQKTNQQTNEQNNENHARTKKQKQREITHTPTTEAMRITLKSTEATGITCVRTQKQRESR